MPSKVAFPTDSRLLIIITNRPFDSSFERVNIYSVEKLTLLEMDTVKSAFYAYKCVIIKLVL